MGSVTLGNWWRKVKVQVRGYKVTLDTLNIYKKITYTPAYEAGSYCAPIGGFGNYVTLSPLTCGFIREEVTNG